MRSKALAALAAGLVPIICVGETRAAHAAGEAASVVAAQLKGSVPADVAPAGLVIAYEPVWAIGTGLTPTPQDVAKMHAFVRQDLATHLAAGAARVRILYGGSVKPENAAELLAIENVNGALVGGASLKSADFMQIVSACR